jgi:hypothetical protein
LPALNRGGGRGHASRFSAGIASRGGGSGLERRPWRGSGRLESIPWQVLDRTRGPGDTSRASDNRGRGPREGRRGNVQSVSCGPYALGPSGPMAGAMAISCLRGTEPAQVAPHDESREEASNTGARDTRHMRDSKRHPLPEQRGRSALVATPDPIVGIEGQRFGSNSRADHIASFQVRRRGILSRFRVIRKRALSSSRLYIACM